MRSEHDKLILRLLGGINEEEDSASPDQLAAASNVWAPAGRLETRPGYEGIITMPKGIVRSAGTPSGGTMPMYYEDVSANAFTAPVAGGALTLSNLEARDNATSVLGDRLYLGSVGADNTWSVHQYRVTLSNGNITAFVAEYSSSATGGVNATDVNGWSPLIVTELDALGGSMGVGSRRINFMAVPAGGTPSVYFSLVPPQDWAAGILTGTGVVEAVRRFWIRLTFLGANLDASTVIDAIDGRTGIIVDSAARMVDIRALHHVQFRTQSRFFISYRTVSTFANNNIREDTILATSNATNVRLNQNAGSFVSGVTNAYGSGTFGSYGTGLNVPGTIAVVSEVDEAYLAYDHTVTMHQPTDTSDSTLTLNTRLALVESRDFAVGAGAPYTPTFIAQLSAWPQANFTTFFDHRLWSGGIKDEPFTIRWSAPAPYHRVWPALSNDLLQEDDNSKITGLAVMGEQLVVFKGRSIWIMVSAGVGPFGLEYYIARKVVSGVGCVAPATIQQVRGALIFLGDDGIYAFDGTPDVRKVTVHRGADRLRTTMQTITPGYRHLSCSANWKSKKCYLLSIPTGGATTNNTVIAWDYEHDSLWLWSNIAATCWMVEDQVYGQEKLYFGNNRGNIYLFGVGATDYGAAISASARTHRLFYDDIGDEKRRLRYVRAIGTNEVGNITIEARADDETTGVTGTLDMTDINETTAIIPRRRARRIDFNREFNWLQLQFTHSTRNQRLQLGPIHVGTSPVGVR